MTDGSELERWIKNAERNLRHQQIATFWKIPNDLRLTKDSVVFGERGPCDFIGHDVGGTAILLEAKSTSVPRLAVPHPRGIKGHQWMALRDASAAGAHALIVWRHDNEVAVLTFDRADELRGSRRSIPWPGGHSFEMNEPTLVVVRALVEVLDLNHKFVDPRI